VRFTKPFSGVKKHAYIDISLPYPKLVSKI